eukprot:GHVS01106627.1.p1 GENE.GHVS01106627.1~~GHVS01106627.1.p1  ORF type:complete len:748 (+),score=191.13 GHVS01106627.1:44-2245(+)
MPIPEGFSALSGFCSEAIRALSTASLSSFSFRHKSQNSTLPPPPFDVAQLFAPFLLNSHQSLCPSASTTSPSFFLQSASFSSMGPSSANSNSATNSSSSNSSSPCLLSSSSLPPPAIGHLRSEWHNSLLMSWTSLQLRLGLDVINRRSSPPPPPTAGNHTTTTSTSSSSTSSSSSSLPPRKRLVILGTGWSTVSLLPGLDVRQFDVTIVSPRNYFAFTPFLPSVSAGTLSPRSCIEPIRTFTRRGGKTVMDFFEATATSVDLKKKQVLCSTKAGDKFPLDYDILVLGVGAESNTFGIPGAKEHSNFLKEVENAREIHKKILDNFERAAVPGISEKDKERLLHFVVVGGGPTGVETAAEISDFIRADILRYFPQLKPYTKVSLIEMLPKVLPMFGDEVSQFALKNFEKLNINTMLNTRVTKVTENSITVLSPSPSSPSSSSSPAAASFPPPAPVEESFPYGFIVWASGVGQVPLSCALLAQLPAAQGKNRVLHVDARLQVKGCSEGTVFALGDCSRVAPAPLQADKELLDSLERKASLLLVTPTTTAETTTHLGLSTDLLAAEAPALSTRYPQIAKAHWDFQTKPSRANMTKQQMVDYLAEIDANYRPPAPTAQYAAQEGLYLARALNQFYGLVDQKNTAATAVAGEEEKAPAFQQQWKGYLAYVGGGQAVADLPGGYKVLGGISSYLLWKGVYLQLCKSVRNVIIVTSDWTRTFIGGRDVGRDHTRDASGTRD